MRRRSRSYSRWLARAARLVPAIAVLLTGLGSVATEPAAAKTQGFPGSGIAIADNREASPYPATIQVSGFETNITRVAVLLRGFSHTAPEDVDLLLVGPQGQTAIIMSDVGGLNVVGNVNITLDDRAANPLPQGNALSTGTFRPANYPGSSDVFPGPAPQSPSSNAALSVFEGTDPNGTWRLFAVDRGAGYSGDIDAWSLLITTENAAPTAEPDSFQTKAGKRLIVAPAGVLANDSDPDDDELTAVLVTPPKKGTLVLRPNGGFTYTPKKGAKGPDTFTYQAKDRDGLTDTATVRILITRGKR